MITKEAFNQKIKLRFNLYSSFFSNLPFKNIKRNSLIFNFFKEWIKQNFNQSNEKLNDCYEIINFFFKDQKINQAEINNYLFKFIQIIEREITLFDAIEDTMFSSWNKKNQKGQGSLDHFLNKIDRDWKLKQLLQNLQDYKIRIVLTAHPTQFYPIYILNIIEELSQEIKNKNIENINTSLKQLAYSSFLNREKPSPIEEATSIIVFLKKIFYYIIPDIEWEIENKLKNNLPHFKKNEYLPPLIEIGFWPGGDRDGNPLVTHQTTYQVALLLKQAIIKCYIKELKLLKKKLTFKGILNKVNQIIINLKKNLDNKSLSNQEYPLNEFEQDIKTLIDEVREKYDSLFLYLIKKFYKKIKSFGFHFSTMDIRQHAKIHSQLIKELFNFYLDAQEYDYYYKQKPQKKVVCLKQLKKIIQDQDSTLEKFYHSKKELDLPLETLQSIEQFFLIQHQNGEKALNRYIISNTEKVENILEVLFLFQLFKKKLNLQGELALDIIPLFESIESLKAANQIMDDLYKNPYYFEHLKKRNSTQTIMLGYSDSTKDGGYLTANWSIYQSKEKLTSMAKKNNVQVIFFDGRGGPPSRGGGNTHKFYNSLSDKISKREIQLTIQGQTISSNFGSYSSAKFNLEELFTAGLENRLYSQEQNQISRKNESLLNIMSKISNEKYFNLIQHRQFIAYLLNFTPINYYGRSNISSRPTKRNQDQNFNLRDLRAIPFVSSWNQIKQNIPAFYGLGTALKKIMETQGLDQLIRVYQESLFFRALIGNAIQSLLKTNFKLTIFIKRKTPYKLIWNDLEKETKLTKKMILEITQKKELLLDTLMNKESIKFREKIVLPLLVIQQYSIINLYLIKQGIIKFSPKIINTYEKIIIRSLAGIINAGRNSA